MLSPSLLMSVLPCVSGTASSVSSAYIVGYILCHRLFFPQVGNPATRQHAQPPTYFRILLGLSAHDIVVSISQALASLPVPKGFPNSPWASGNQQTCTAQGFFWTLGIPAMLYNASLALFFLATIVFEKRLDWVGGKMERWLHIVPIAHGLLWSFVGLATQSYNPFPSGAICGIYPHPYECVFNPSVPCERGEHAYALFWTMIVVPVVLSFIIVLVSMIFIVCKVWRQEKRMQRFDFSRWAPQSVKIKRESSLRRSLRTVAEMVLRKTESNRQEEATAVATPATTATSPSLNRSDGTLRRTRSTAVLALFYAGSFFLSSVWLFAIMAVEAITYAVPFWLICVSMFFQPLQGLFNFLIFKYTTNGNRCFCSAAFVGCVCPCSKNEKGVDEEDDEREGAGRVLACYEHRDNLDEPGTQLGNNQRGPRNGALDTFEDEGRAKEYGDLEQSWDADS